MKTVDALYKKYQDKFVPLVTVAVDYYGAEGRRNGESESDFNIRINRMRNGRLPGLNPFRPNKSQKTPYFVDIENLADALDSRAREARIG